jgi:hypothetical protein
MSTHSNNGAGRNVALPKENRPSWSPHDDPARNRRMMSEDEWPRDRREDRAIGYAGDIDHDTAQFGHGPHRGKGPINYQRSDERIREDVCEALTDNEYVDASRIEVNVADGEVNLTGRVSDRRTKRLAEDCAERVSGVRDVHNHLRIGDAAKVPESKAPAPKH